MAEEPLKVPEHVTLICVADARRALARISAVWFGRPAGKLITIGVTGTKGKTTTAWMIREILEQAGYRTGLLGTVACITGKREFTPENTTPESYLVQKYLAEMAEAGLRCAVMEVSSQALKQSRVEGILFDYGIFTNIEADHIAPGEHDSFEEYLECKKKLLRQCRLGIVNRDDRHFRRIVQGHTCRLETFGLQGPADLRAEEIQLTAVRGCPGVSFRVRGKLEFQAEVSMPGRFSVYNALAAAAVCRHLGASQAAMGRALRQVKVRGRVEPVPVSGEFTLLIDYAHNAMSLESLLRALREYRPKRLICLFGCGGNRDRNRRF